MTVRSEDRSLQRRDVGRPQLIRTSLKPAQQVVHDAGQIGHPGLRRNRGGALALGSGGEPGGHCVALASDGD